MRELKDYEVNDIIECLPYTDRNGWEQTRLLGYTQVQVNSKKKLEPTELIKLPWDNEKQESATEISNADIARLRDKANQITKQLRNGKEL